MNLIKSTLVAVLCGSFTMVNAQGTEKVTADVKESTQVQVMGTEAQSTPSIVGVAASNEAFATLVAAVKAADLVGTLESAGPFTVFAPTNDAFAKLPDGTVESLLKPENKKALAGILTYHVVAGKFMAADVVKAIQDNNNAFVVKTVNGQSLTLSVKDGSVMVTDANGNAAKVTATDVKASNGVIHVIDSVVLPK
ncbi:fasciclin domain-containing protein [Robiginitalea aurantiaca]|uniref:Fasciclin domain-containing protein n=1 Tax=Robiginitalea aurantiaca TaxID=3056915 RepID=A0ABT7WFN0_9FLAO|nr:fasciclin domain-containing protein [Robiginitalea aurantiaca]MDM9631727.1 fasciclin domain-containing protein [Robiginitalea aurantiaca]